MTEFTSAIAFFVIFALILSVVSFVMYLLQAIGIYKMGKNMGLTSPWIAFIPIVNKYAFGRIAEKYIKTDGRPSAKFSKILLALEIVSMVLVLVIIVALFIGLIAEAVVANSYADPDFYLGSDEFVSSTIYSILLPMIIGEFVLIGFSIAKTVITYVALWRIFVIFDMETATVYLVLSIFFNFVQPIIIFILRNRQPRIFMPQPVAEEQLENVM